VKTSRPFIECPLVQLTLVRYREFLREPEALFWVFVFPILLAAGLGIAFRNRPAETLKVAAENTQLAAALRDKSLSVQVMSREQGEQALRTGRISLLAIPGPHAGVTYRYDDTNPDGRAARLLAERAILRSAGVADPAPEADSLVREPGSRYIDFLIPGLLGMNLMGSGMWGLGFAIVDARRKHLLKRLVVSPMSKTQYLLSFLLSRLTLLFAEVAVLLAFGVLAFGIPLRGSLLQLAALCLLGGLAFSAIGLLVASRARTMEAVSGLMNLVMLPMWVFSGVFFSAERFPAVAQPFIQALPLTAVVNAFRANMIEGSALSQFPGEIALIAGWLVVSFFTALRLFRWR
jgi:ABC-type multidrug transport system permease subunit